jgi:glucoamylase
VVKAVGQFEGILMSDNELFAPGWPGIEPTWTSSAKEGVGTALAPVGHVWFTISHGILNEVYYPRVDTACTRDAGMIVTDGVSFFSQEKRHTTHEVSTVAPGVPAFHIVNTCVEGRYRIEKDILTDPDRDVLLQRVRLTPLVGALTDYHLYLLLAPHMGNRGYGNTAWVGDYKGVPMLFAERDGNALALACSVPWRAMSVGFVGASDGWLDLNANKRLTTLYTRAENGNVAMTAEVDLSEANPSYVIAVGFGRTGAEAGQRARASLQVGYDVSESSYTGEWRRWQERLLAHEREERPGRYVYRVSTAVLRTHEAQHFPGGIIASLSIPWGFAKGDDDLGGYHLVWPRDLVETAGALLAAGAPADAHRVIHYLQATQEADGHWPQNMWLDGTPYWTGVQMDETAFPILLVDLARRHQALEAADVARLWPMVRKAAGFVARSGPVTQQDRWEEDPGYSPFTLAVEIAGLLAAADLAEVNSEPALAEYLRETADVWNENIERWIYVTNTSIARQVGVDGYYVRIAPPDIASAKSPAEGYVPIKNRPPGQSSAPARQIVSPDALALVRLGLRQADDPRITNTVKVIDALLKVDIPAGPVWHRYNNDGYGEHEDGAPFDGTGVGRPWPLLTGERAHYELAAGRSDAARKLAVTLAACANEGGLLSEQVWDAPDIPERELYCGRPSGSAMPLVWAHAEYIKLCRSLHDGNVFDMPPQPAQRYAAGVRQTPYAIWRFNHRCRAIAAGRVLRVEVLAQAVVHWSGDGWQTVQDMATRDTGIGVHVADLPTADLAAGASIEFTFYWPQAQRWEGTNYSVAVEESAPVAIPAHLA